MMQLVVDGVGLEERFGALLTDDFDEKPPVPKTEWASVPFGTDVDMTQAAGEVAYENREHTFVLLVRGGEKPALALINFLNGRRAEYTIPGHEPWTYSGRFSLNKKERVTRDASLLTFKAESSPWRLRAPTVFSINAAGGVVVDVQSGRMPVQPTITVQRAAVVVSEGVEAIVEAGSWVSDYVWWHEGINRLYINTLTGSGDQLLEDIWDVPLSEIWDKRLAELYWTEAPSTPQTLGEIWDVPLSEIWDTRIIELSNPIDTDNPEYNATIYAEWGDL